METSSSVILIFLTLFVLTIYIFFLIHKGRKKRSNYILAFFFLTQGVGILPNLFFHDYDYYSSHFPNALYLPMPFSLLWAPSLFLYVRSITQKKFWQDWKHLLHFMPFLGLYIYLTFNFFIFDLDTKHKILKEGIPLPGKNFDIFMAAIFIQVVVYNIASVRSLYLYKKRNFSALNQKEITDLKWLEYIVYGYVIVCFLNTGVMRGIDLFYDLNEQNISLLLFLIFFTVLFYNALTRPQVFIPVEEKPKYQYSQLDSQSAESLSKRVDQFIAKEKPYLKPNITIKELAQQLEISPRYLSQVINDQKGQNFHDFINSLRIKEAQKILSDPDSDLNILQVLYEVGFNSKTSFNVTFKKHTGMTPTQYRKKYIRIS